MPDENHSRNAGDLLEQIAEFSAFLIIKALLGRAGRP
jgi:hypothetical protein